MRKLGSLLFLFLPLLAISQSRLHMTVFGGFSNYQGDLQEKRFTTDQSNGALGIGVKYDITNKFAIRSGINIGKIEADDKRNKDPDLRTRNLNFQSRLFEWNVLAEYSFIDLEDRWISPYVFGGLALFRFNPYTYDQQGNRYYLQELSTEGQGLPEYPDVKPYKLIQVSLPFGAGVKFRITENTSLGFEVGMRKTFTDYLDDVSGRYIDEDILRLAKSAKAVELAYRTDELVDGNQQYPDAGTLRGGAKHKDWYYFSGLTLSFRINNGNGSSRGKGGTGCPGSVL